jgi:hypothetical protein
MGRWISAGLLGISLGLGALAIGLVLGLIETIDFRAVRRLALVTFALAGVSLAGLAAALGAVSRGGLGLGPYLLIWYHGAVALITGLVTAANVSPTAQAWLTGGLKLVLP